ncbi:NADPH-dependent FMN reductase [Bordetella sp. LUAb4]|uniref:NADPH-dependent FMN reductase n=1 Tax=Bordetella sp. LUAb4 TaxID=2843195 RepID=UPI001E56FFCF|nr:NADPH-dependent FMN reductase [Bordetella sp. LUAb4]
MTVLALAGSPSLSSRSSALLHRAAALLGERGLAVSTLGLRDLPAEDLIEGNYAGPAAAALRARVHAASALLIATPVYKASFSGGLKAVLDLLDEKALAGKVVLPIATGGSLAHLLALEYTLKPVLSALGARHILGSVFATEQQVRLTDDGAAVLDDELNQRLHGGVEQLARHVAPPPAPAERYDLGQLLAQARFSI